jgi:hypothetical protein
MRNLYLLLAATMFVAGCDKDDTDTDETDTGDADTDTDTDTDADPTVESYAWDATGLTVTVSDPGTGWSLGLAETGTADDSKAWFGEDCFNGSAGYTYCHSFTTATGTLTALAGGDRTADNVVEGEKTLLNQSLAMNGATDLLTYMVTWDDGTCTVWGEDVGTDTNGDGMNNDTEDGYYKSFNCMIRD